MFNNNNNNNQSDVEVDVVHQTLLYEDAVGDIFLNKPGDNPHCNIEAVTLLDCDAYLLDTNTSVSAHQLSHSNLFIGPCTGTVTLSDCNSCMVTVACQELVITRCTDCVIYLCCNKQVSLEASIGIKLAPFNAAWPGLRDQFRDARIDPRNNRWDVVQDIGGNNEANNVASTWSLVRPGEVLDNETSSVTDFGLLKLREAFDLFDTDKDNALCASELNAYQRATLSEDLVSHEDNLEAMFDGSGIQLNAQGNLPFESFCQLYARQPSELMSDLVTLGIDHTRLLNNVIMRAGYEFLQVEDLPPNVEQVLNALGLCENPCDTVSEDVSRHSSTLPPSIITSTSPRQQQQQTVTSPLFSSSRARSGSSKAYSPSYLARNSVGVDGEIKESNSEGKRENSNEWERDMALIVEQAALSGINVLKWFASFDKNNEDSNAPRHRSHVIRNMSHGARERTVTREKFENAISGLCLSLCATDPLRLEETVSRVLQPTTLKRITQAFTQDHTGRVNYRALVRRVQTVRTGKTNTKPRKARNKPKPKPVVVIATAVRRPEIDLRQSRRHKKYRALSASNVPRPFMSVRPLCHSVKSVSDLEEKMAKYLGSRHDALQVVHATMRAWHLTTNSRIFVLPETTTDAADNVITLWSIVMAFQELSLDVPLRIVKELVNKIQQGFESVEEEKMRWLCLDTYASGDATTRLGNGTIGGTTGSIGKHISSNESVSVSALLRWVARVGHPNGLSFRAWMVKKRSIVEEEEILLKKSTSRSAAASLPPAGDRLLVASAAQGHAQAIVRLTQQMSHARMNTLISKYLGAQVSDAALEQEALAMTERWLETPDGRAAIRRRVMRLKTDQALEEATIDQEEQEQEQEEQVNEEDAYDDADDDFDQDGEGNVESKIALPKSNAPSGIKSQWNKARGEIISERVTAHVTQYRKDPETLQVIFAKYAHEVKNGEATGTSLEDWLYSRRDKLNQTRQALRDWTREKRTTLGFERSMNNDEIVNENDKCNGSLSIPKFEHSKPMEHWGPVMQIHDKLRALFDSTLLSIELSSSQVICRSSRYIGLDAEQHLALLRKRHAVARTAILERVPGTTHYKGISNHISRNGSSLETSDVEHPDLNDSINTYAFLSHSEFLQLFGGVLQSLRADSCARQRAMDFLDPIGSAREAVDALIATPSGAQKLDEYVQLILSEEHEGIRDVDSDNGSLGGNESIGDIDSSDLGEEKKKNRTARAKAKARALLDGDMEKQIWTQCGFTVALPKGQIPSVDTAGGVKAETLERNSAAQSSFTAWLQLKDKQENAQRKAIRKAKRAQAKKDRHESGKQQQKQQRQYKNYNGVRKKTIKKSVVGFGTSVGRNGSIDIRGNGYADGGRNGYNSSGPIGDGNKKIPKKSIPKKMIKTNSSGQGRNSMNNKRGLSFKQWSKASQRGKYFSCGADGRWRLRSHPLDPEVLLQREESARPAWFAESLGD